MSGSRRRRAARRARARAPARRGSSTSCSAPVPTATTSAPARRTDARPRSSTTPHGVDLGPLEPRLPDGLRTPSGQIELAPAADRRRPAADGAALDARRPTACCWSAAATCARTTRGCTTSRCWSRASRAARCRSIPTTPTRLGLIDGGHATVTSRVGTVVVPVEVTDEIRPASSASPTVGATTCRRAGWRRRAATPASTPTCSTDEAVIDPLPAPPCSTASPSSWPPPDLGDVRAHGRRAGARGTVTVRTGPRWASPSGSASSSLLLRSQALCR